MARRRKGPLVPGAEAGLDALRERLQQDRRVRLPADAERHSDAVLRFREIAHRYAAEHEPAPKP